MKLNENLNDIIDEIIKKLDNLNYSSNYYHRIAFLRESEQIDFLEYYFFKKDKLFIGRVP